jgi:hypothetical protein
MRPKVARPKAAMLTAGRRPGPPFLPCSDEVRASYASLHGGAAPDVSAADFAFAAHAVLATLLVSGQYAVMARPGDKKLSPIAAGVGVAVLAACGGSAAHINATCDLSDCASWLPLLVLLGGVKVRCARGREVVVAVARAVCGQPGGTAVRGGQQCGGLRRCPTGQLQGPANAPNDRHNPPPTQVVMTLVKYTPQVLHNHRRRSTEGWNLTNVLLDLGGGVLSMAQVDAGANNHLGTPSGVGWVAIKAGGAHAICSTSRVHASLLLCKVACRPPIRQLARRLTRLPPSHLAPLPAPGAARRCGAP